MKLSNLTLTALAALSLIMASCAKDETLLDSVPADVEVAMMLNGKSLFADLNLSTARPATLSFLNIAPEKLNLLVRASEAIDEQNIVSWSEKSGNSYQTFTVTDRPAFCHALRTLGCDSTSTGGYSVFADNGYSVVLLNNQAWLIEADAATSVAEVKKLLKRASDKALADVKAVQQAFKGNHMMELVVNGGIFSKKIAQEQWGYMTVDVKDSVIEGNCSWLKADGSQFEPRGLRRINTPVLQYAPEGAMIVAAMGVSKQLDWDNSIDIASTLCGLSTVQKSQISMLLPYLKALDGTAMIAVAPVEGAEPPAPDAVLADPAKLRVIAMLQMDADKVDEAVGAATGFAAGLGTVRQVREGLYQLDSPLGVPFYVGNVEGAFTIANFEPDDRHDATIAGKFTGKMGGFCVQLPSLSALIDGADYGIDMLVTGGNGTGHYTIAFPGAEQSPLLTMADLMMRMADKY